MSALGLDERTIRDALEVIAGLPFREERSRPVRDYVAGRVTFNVRAREVYSYGTHFPLFRFVPRELNGWRDVFVINGDEWRGNGRHPSRTPDHQEIARRAIAGTGMRSVIIPFSAIGGSGLELDSVRPVHVREDARWDEPREADRLEDVPRWARSRWSDSANAMVDIARGADGIYRWSEPMHRLGDALISAVRLDVFTRDARPFETDSESAREVVTCPAPGERFCRAASVATDNRSDLHETGPSGACVHCGRPLSARVEVRRRARYLSSFDMNERPPLYFLAQVPRGAGGTVESAIDSLAPRAVHAAIARGRDVRRQGDVFFIETDLSTLELELRGARFARLTQWTRDARARRGEVCYRAPLTAAARRRETAYARRLFHERFSPYLDRASDRAPSMNPSLREANRARWDEFLSENRRPAEVNAFRLEGRRRELKVGSPQTDRGARRRWKARRAECDARVSAARVALQSALAAPARVTRDTSRYPSHYFYGSSVLTESRRRYCESVRRARESLTRAIELAENAHGGRIAERDRYRAIGVGDAHRLHVSVWATARARFEPDEFERTAREKRRETVRRALAVYGTAHSATRVATVRGAVYVAGTVRHVPELEPGRVGAPDHRPLELAPDRWYLAVRNTVPRQSSARRQRAAGRRTVSG